jgi:hypothetical protein
MAFIVTDASVREYAERIRNGKNAGQVFPGKMSECEFTPEQREIIKAARLHRKAQLKLIANGNSIAPAPPADPARKTEPPSNGGPKAPTLTKLEKMLYLQGGKCFFCGERLEPGEASIEHLMPLSQGGPRNETNEVVCHKTVNDAFGAMDLKRKVEFILRASGQFQCPKTRKSK